MKTLNKKNHITIVLILVLTFSIIPITYLSSANAQEYDNFAHITVAPNPVGVNQETIVLFFLSIPSPTATAGFHEGNWEGFMVTVTDPNGHTEEFGPYNSDATGGAFFQYTPTQVGEYTLDFEFPGQVVQGLNFLGIPIGPYTYGPESASTTLTVQEEPIIGYQTPPPPTGYWDRPIYGENRGWYTLAGNWLSERYSPGFFFGGFNPYTTAPNTAHIVWTIEQYLGGVVGGDLGDLNYYQAPTYQPYWVPPLIISGRLYYMERQVPGAVEGWVGLHCVDIRTGEELWFQDVSVIGGVGAGGGGQTFSLFGQLFDAEGANGHGVEAFLWNLGANWKVFDANSGRPVYTIANPPIATSPFALFPGVSGPHVMNVAVDRWGSMIAYYVDGINNWLVKWNSTKLLIEHAGGSTSDMHEPPYGETLNWSDGIEWNVTIPDRAGTPGFYQGGPMPSSDKEVIYCVSADLLNPVDEFMLTAYSAKDGHELWYSDFSDVFVRGSTLWEFFGPVMDGVMTVYEKNSMRWYGYDQNTGVKLWGPTDPYDNAWDIYTNTNAAYGKLYVGTYGGKIFCHNIQTGALEWTYALPPSGYDTPYGSYPVNKITVADGKLYAITGEHTPNSPYWLGGAMYCVNATSGDGIYQMSGWWSPGPAIADGYLLGHNCYDGTIYCFGKGQTATTVEAPHTAVTLGTGLLITGTVTDQSPGYTCLGIPTAGTPAIADEYMTEWMEYLHQQKPIPEDAQGVPVRIDVLDSNNNYRNIGTTTSDANGFFSLAWKPDIPGKFTVYAYFEGSESYYGSFAETAFLVDEAAPGGPIEPEPPTPEQPTEVPVPTEVPTEQPTEPEPEAPFITTEIAIIIAVSVIAVVAIAAYWVYRRRQ